MSDLWPMLFPKECPVPMNPEGSDGLFHWEMERQDLECRLTLELTLKLAECMKPNAVSHTSSSIALALEDLAGNKNTSQAQRS